MVLNMADNAYIKYVVFSLQGTNQIDYSIIKELRSLSAVASDILLIFTLFSWTKEILTLTEDVPQFNLH